MASYKMGLKERTRQVVAWLAALGGAVLGCWLSRDWVTSALSQEPVEPVAEDPGLLLALIARVAFAGTAVATAGVVGVFCRPAGPLKPKKPILTVNFLSPGR